MFTKNELEEIGDALRVVYRSIRPNFGSDTSDKYKDSRAAIESAARIVSAKIIANAINNGE